MAKQGLTEIVCVLDRSGSMESVREDSIGGFNRFLKDQKAAPGEARMTVTIFDTVYEIIHDGKPIAEVPDLTHETYIPRGMTALLDAVGRTIDNVGARLKGLTEDERPEKVIFVILTDGQENASKEYTREKLLASINHQQEKYGWEFLYLGANQDAFAVARGIGIAVSGTQLYHADAVDLAYTSASEAVTRGRMGGKASFEKTDAPDT